MYLRGKESRKAEELLGAGVERKPLWGAALSAKFTLGVEGISVSKRVVQGSGLEKGQG